MSVNNDSISLSGSSVGQSKYSIDSYSLLSAKNAPTKFPEFKVTPAFEKGLTKINCGLCRMFFHKDSVFYKVPNNRIISLQKSWHFTQEGRRYQTASYLYKSVTVCTFCSQFFNVSEIELENHEADEKMSPTDFIEKQVLNVSTKVSRSDISSGCRVYHSSTIDDKFADNAVNQPYTLASKTRREADPWWEIDLGRKYNVHSISFLISTGIKQDLGLHIIVLEKPYGFDDPFLESITKKAIVFKEVKLPQSTAIKMEEVSWDLPNDTQCVAIRIQLRGIHSLSLQKFQALQGDNLVDLSTDDQNLNEDSFVSLGPKDLKDYLAEMMTAEKKKQRIYERFPSTSQSGFNVSEVNNLSTAVSRKYSEIEAWKSRVLEHSVLFSPNEIQDMFLVIFKYTADTNSKKNHHQAINEAELMTTGLIQHYPRCDLLELHTRIRSVIRWYQTRTHLKLLGSLASCSAFEPFAIDASDHLYRLLSSFKRVEYYWNKLEEREHNAKKQLNNIVKTTVAETRGCSWSQFLIIMNLFCTAQPLKIPKSAFNINEERVNTPSYLIANAIAASLDDKSTSSASLTSYKSNEGRSVSTFALSSMAGPANNNRSFSPEGNRTRLDSLATKVVKPFEEFPAENRMKSILEAVRKENDLIPCNSAFSEYKFDKMKKKIDFTEIIFPKTLSLEFAKSLIHKRAATSHGMAMKASATTGSLDLNQLQSPSMKSRSNFDTSVHDTLQTLTRSGTARTVGRGISERGLDSDDNASRVSDYSYLSQGSLPRLNSSHNNLIGSGKSTKEEDNLAFIISSPQKEEEFKKEVVDFFRICALCGLKFPRDCMDMQVMRKHIVKLRSAWDPNLISKEVRFLDNTISMYSLVSVCVFCTQYFDPDFPDGIAYPEKTTVEKIKHGPLESIRSQKTEAKMDKFYDNRYEDHIRTSGYTSLTAHSLNKTASRVLETRERARKATEIAIQQHSEKITDHDFA